LEILGAKYEILRFTQDEKKGVSQRSQVPSSGFEDLLREKFKNRHVLELDDCC
jgi:hypothetical protein